MTQTAPKTLLHAYGWRPDIPDKRDLYRRFVPQSLSALPPVVDLRPKCPAIYDQGQLGSCTANGIAFAHQFEQLRQSKTAKSFVPSRLFIYWHERALEGTINQDAGAYIRDGIKVLVKRGVCPEPEWPYIESMFTQKPTIKAHIHALEHQVIKYQRIEQTLQQLRACLAAGYPVVFGWSVYESAESAAAMKTGFRPMPKRSERLLGGHCEALVGYNDAKRIFIVRGSWGPKVGDKGYFYQPYDYLTDSDLSSDFWNVTLVETDICNQINRRIAA